jgi:hypothetical protein
MKSISVELDLEDIQLVSRDSSTYAYALGGEVSDNEKVPA